MKQRAHIKKIFLIVLIFIITIINTSINATANTEIVPKLISINYDKQINDATVQLIADVELPLLEMNYNKFELLVSEGDSEYHSQFLVNNDIENISQKTKILIPFNKHELSEYSKIYMKLKFMYVDSNGDIIAETNYSNNVIIDIEGLVLNGQMVTEAENVRNYLEKEPDDFTFYTDVTTYVNLTIVSVLVVFLIGIIMLGRKKDDNNINKKGKVDNSEKYIVDYD